MKTEQIIILIVSFFLGMLLLNVVKNVCGCDVVEGFDWMVELTPEERDISRTAAGPGGTGIHGCFEELQRCQNINIGNLCSDDQVCMSDETHTYGDGDLTTQIISEVECPGALDANGHYTWDQFLKAWSSVGGCAGGLPTGGGGPSPPPCVANDCPAGTCNEPGACADGICSFVPASLGDPCDDGDDDGTTISRCTSTNDVRACKPSCADAPCQPGPCQISVCDTETGECSDPTLAADDSSCGDGSSGKCIGGECKQTTMWANPQPCVYQSDADGNRQCYTNDNRIQTEPWKCYNMASPYSSVADITNPASPGECVASEPLEDATYDCSADGTLAACPASSGPAPAPPSSVLPSSWDTFLECEAACASPCDPDERYDDERGSYGFFCPASSGAPGPPTSVLPTSYATSTECEAQCTESCDTSIYRAGYFCPASSGGDSGDVGSDILLGAGLAKWVQPGVGEGVVEVGDIGLGSTGDTRRRYGKACDDGSSDIPGFPVGHFTAGEPDLFCNVKVQNTWYWARRDELAMCADTGVDCG